MTAAPKVEGEENPSGRRGPQPTALDRAIKPDATFFRRMKGSHAPARTRSPPRVGGVGDGRRTRAGASVEPVQSLRHELSAWRRPQRNHASITSRDALNSRSVESRIKKVHASSTGQNVDRTIIAGDREGGSSPIVCATCARIPMCRVQIAAKRGAPPAELPGRF